MQYARPTPEAVKRFDYLATTINSENFRQRLTDLRGEGWEASVGHFTELTDPDGNSYRFQNGEFRTSKQLIKAASETPPGSGPFQLRNAAEYWVLQDGHSNSSSVTTETGGRKITIWKGTNDELEFELLSPSSHLEYFQPHLTHYQPPRQKRPSSPVARGICEP